ncbi:MAG: hypothetical protein WD266_03035 [Balneolales bacterium]
MTKEKGKLIEETRLHYIEETGLLLEETGMTRMAGRIFGYLIICDEDAASFDRIREVLHASKGSISTNLKQLIQVGFIEPISLPRDRKTYYRLSPMNISDIMKARYGIIRKFVDLFIRGRELKTREDYVSQWLLESSSFYSWLEEQTDDMINRWERDKHQIIEQMRKKL